MWLSGAQNSSITGTCIISNKFNIRRMETKNRNSQVQRCHQIQQSCTSCLLCWTKLHITSTWINMVMQLITNHSLFYNNDPGKKPPSRTQHTVFIAHRKFPAIYQWSNHPRQHCCLLIPKPASHPALKNNQRRDTIAPLVIPTKSYPRFCSMRAHQSTRPAEPPAAAPHSVTSPQEPPTL
jgi:hypothetical protein